MIGKGSRQSNSTITHLRMGFIWQPEILEAGWAIQGRFVLLHPPRPPRQAGRFDVSSLALNGAIFNSGLWLMSAARASDFSGHDRHSLVPCPVSSCERAYAMNLF
jgi:hypothetical protein